MTKGTSGRARLQPLLLAALLTMAMGCSSTGVEDGDTAADAWWVAGTVAIVVRGGSDPVLTGIQVLIDGRVAYTHSGSPTVAMTGGFGLETLPQGNHVMKLKVVSQVGTTATYRVVAALQMSLGTSGTNTSSFNWPDQILTLRAGDEVEFPFKVPL